MSKMGGELDKRLDLAKYDFLDVLETLLEVYYMNRNSDGKCPNPHEFIACVTPEGIPLHWRKAKMIVEYVRSPK